MTLQEVAALQDHDGVKLIAEISGRSTADVATFAAALQAETPEIPMDHILVLGVLAAVLDQVTPSPFDQAAAPGGYVIMV